MMIQCLHKATLIFNSLCKQPVLTDAHTVMSSCLHNSIDASAIVFYLFLYTLSDKKVSMCFKLNTQTIFYVLKA